MKLRAFLAAFFFTTSAAHAAIAFDASSSGASVSGVVTFSQTCTGSSLVLVVGTHNIAAQVPTSVTYNGAAMTLQRTDNETSIYYLIGPATGAHNVVVTYPLGSPSVGGAMSFTGVHQVSPIDAANGGSGVGSGISQTITTATLGDMLVEVVGVHTGASPSTPTASQTSTYSNNSNTVESGNGAYKAVIGATTYTETWTGGSAASYGFSMVALKSAVPFAISPTLFFFNSLLEKLSNGFEGSALASGGFPW